jgi:hypothetical protein
LTACQIEPLAEPQARAVGVLAGKAGHDDIVDVAVVESAVRRRDGIVTSNDAHIRRVMNAAGVKLRLEAI